MNPMLDMLNQSSTQPQQNNIQAIVSQAKNMMQGGNGQAIKTVMQMCRGKDPKKLFYSKCKEMGVNPNDILSLLK